MGGTFIEYFDREQLAWLRVNYAPSSMSRLDLLDDKYLLVADGQYSVYYGPIGAWPPPNTRIVFVGLTPGFTQLEAAAKIFLNSPDWLRMDDIAYANELRKHVAFAGTMRRNLCTMLDSIGVPAHFGFERSEQLFSEEARDVAAATSALVFPVFAGQSLKNFAGSYDLSARPLFREMLMEFLLPRLQRAPQARIIPLGLSASSGVDYLVRVGSIDTARVLRNFPHPSGGNGHRVRLFNRDREELAATVACWDSSAAVRASSSEFRESSPAENRQ